MQNVAAAVENSMEVPQKVKNSVTRWSRTSTTGYITKDQKQGLKQILYTIHSNIIHDNQQVEATRVSMDKWRTNNMRYVVQWNIINLQKEGSLAWATTWMNPEDKLSEAGQSQCDPFRWGT